MKHQTFLAFSLKIFARFVFSPALLAATRPSSRRHRTCYVGVRELENKLRRIEHADIPNEIRLPNGHGGTHELGSKIEMNQRIALLRTRIPVCEGLFHQRRRSPKATCTKNKSI